MRRAAVFAVSFAPQRITGRHINSETFIGLPPGAKRASRRIGAAAPRLPAVQWFLRMTFSARSLAAFEKVS